MRQVTPVAIACMTTLVACALPESEGPGVDVLEQPAVSADGYGWDPKEPRWHFEDGRWKYSWCDGNVARIWITTESGTEWEGEIWSEECDPYQKKRCWNPGEIRLLERYTAPMGVFTYTSTRLQEWAACKYDHDLEDPPQYGPVADAGDARAEPLRTTPDPVCSSACELDMGGRASCSS